MKEIKKTFEDLQKVDQIVGGLYAKNPKLKDSKFGYAYKRFTDKNYVPAIRDFNDELGALRVKHALEDATTKEVLLDEKNPRGFKYSKTGLMDLLKEEKALEETFKKKEITVIPYLSPNIPVEMKDLPDDERKMLDGLVL